MPALGSTLSKLPDDLGLVHLQVPPSPQRPRSVRHVTMPAMSVKVVPPCPGRAPPRLIRRLEEGTVIGDVYELGEEIYKCQKGRVVVAKRCSDGGEVVVKVRYRTMSKNNELHWRHIMARLVHVARSSHVLEILDIIETSNAFYVVMPKCNGGDLFAFLENSSELREEDCKKIVRELLISVGHLHSHNILHRDIKLENVMLERQGDETCGTVKLIDFDTCMEWPPTMGASSKRVGSPGYIAPEASLEGNYSPQSDLWSVGVIFYTLVVDEIPWHENVVDEDTIAALDWNEMPWATFPLARDLCQKLLAFDTTSRLLSAKEALSHEWFSDDADAAAKE